MRTVTTFRALTAALLLAACGGDGSNGIGPGNQLQVTNAADDFQLQVTSMHNVTETLRYAWTNTGDSASINQATVVTGGTATLAPLDITKPDAINATDARCATDAGRRGMANIDIDAASGETTKTTPRARPSRTSTAPASSTSCTRGVR